MINLTKSLSVEWAQNGVRVNAVAPGVIWSATAGANYKSASGGEILLSSQWLRCPAKRIGTVEEVSAAVCFLLSPASAFTTGETIKVDGASSLKNEMYIADHDNLPAYGRIPPPKPQREEIVKAFRGVREDAFWPDRLATMTQGVNQQQHRNCDIALRVLRFFCLRSVLKILLEKEQGQYKRLK